MCNAELEQDEHLWLIIYIKKKIHSLYGEKSSIFSLKNFIFDLRKTDMNILDEMGVSKLSGNIYSGTNPLNVAPSVSMGVVFFVYRFIR